MERWQVHLKASDGTLLALIDEYAGWSYERRVNSPGGWALRLAKRADESVDDFEARCALWELDGQVEFWHSNDSPAIAWRLDYEGLIRWKRWSVTEAGALVFEVGGRGYIDLLARRIIAAAAGSAHARWTSEPAETIMKDIVEYQCGPSAGAGRSIAGLSVEADGGNGNTLTLARAYKPVLEVLQELAAIGGGDFDVVSVGAALFEFRWYTGQRGTDRSADVIFALERGNMAAPQLAEARQDEVNAVLVGGQGEGATRTTVWRTDATRIADSPLNRCEVYRDARDESDTDGLNALGDAMLEEGRPKLELSFEVLQTPTCAYGAHYFVGDLVTAKFLAYESTKKIVAITVTAGDEGTTKAVELADVG